MLSTKAFSELLEVLHSTAIAPENWEHFLARLCVLTEARHGFFLCSSSHAGLRMLSHGGTEDMAAAQKRYNDSGGEMDPFRMPILMHPRTGVLDGDEILPPEELFRTLAYREILEPAGLRYLTAMALSVTPRRMEALSFWRGIDQGPMRAENRELLGLLIPHVKIALEVRHALAATERRSDDLQMMLDSAVAACFLLSSQGKILLHNEEACTLLDEGTSVQIRRNRLYPVVRGQDREWQQLFSPTETDASGNPAGGAMLLTRAAGRPLQVVAMPWNGNGDAGTREGMLLLITDPDRHRKYPDAVLKGLYGLTPAETEVANAYLTGYTTEEISQLRRVSLSTVRSQLKVLLQKTNTRRQSDLLRVLMSIPRTAEQ